MTSHTPPQYRSGAMKYTRSDNDLEEGTGLLGQASPRAPAREHGKANGVHEPAKPPVEVSFFSPAALASEAAYCLTSAGTILFNKHALSTFNFPAPKSLLLFQFVLSVMIVKVLDLLRAGKVHPLKWELVKLWFPVNLIFVAMNVTGFYALMYIGAGMFTLLKNLSNLLTIFGDWAFFGYKYSWNVWLSLGLMLISALMGGWTDAKFTVEGYSWQIANCVFTAAYSLYLSHVVRKSTENLPPSQQLNEISMVYYNNVLALIPLLFLVVGFGEVESLQHAKMLTSPEFVFVAVLGGLLGFGVSFASMWCMSRTSATVYSLTGSMNKVIVAVVGMWFFKEPTNATNLTSIVVGLVAGYIFVFAKSQVQKP